MRWYEDSFSDEVRRGVVYLSMHFGLENCPAAFQKLIDPIFSDMREFTDVYIDDILIFSDSLDDYLQ